MSDKEKKTGEKQLPIAKQRLGKLRTAVWDRDGRKNAVLEKRWLKAGGDKTKNEDYESQKLGLFPEEIPAAIALLKKAQEACFETEGD